MSNMQPGFKRKDNHLLQDYLAIIASDLPEVDRVAKAFTLVTEMHLRETEKEIELSRAMSDQENIIKCQVKRNMIEYVQSIFNDAYWRVTGRKLEEIRE